MSAMFPLFGSLKDLVKLQHITTDNVVFRLHYQATVVFLCAFGIALSTRQFLGDPIHCTLPADEIKEAIIDSYCWIHSTFTLPGTVGLPIDTQVAYPGVDNYKPGDDTQYHAYYQWVCFVLIVQAAMFYIPRWLWSNWEGGKIEHLMLDLDKPMAEDSAKLKSRNKLCEYLYNSIGYQNSYAFKYFFCEILNFINVIGQIYFVNRFLDGQFTSYGADVIAFTEQDQEYRDDPMIKVFPRVTKCTFRRFGPSGDIQRHDSLCVLPLNIINEKIYVFLWFWFVILAILSTVALIYRLVILLLPKVRYAILKSRVKPADQDKLRDILRRTYIGDWFVLFMLGKNMDQMNFKEIVNKLHKKMVEDLKGDDEKTSTSMA